MRFKFHINTNNFLVYVSSAIFTLQIICCLSEIPVSPDILYFICCLSRSVIFLHQLTGSLGSFRLMSQGLPLPGRGPASFSRWRIPRQALIGWPEPCVHLWGQSHPRGLPSEGGVTPSGFKWKISREPLIDGVLLPLWDGTGVSLIGRLTVLD